MVLADLRLCSCSPFPFHTHNFTYTRACLASAWPAACITLVSPSPYSECWLINIRDSVFSHFFVLCTNRFSFLVLETDRKKFSPPPPRVLSPIVSLFTFYPTLHLPDFLRPACFSACLLLLRVHLCPCGTARVSLSVWVGLKGFCVCLLFLKKGYW